MHRDNRQGERLVTDLLSLNSNVGCLGWPFWSSNELQKNILTDSKVFWVIDFLSRYFQIPIAKESRNYTAFLSPFGKFLYKRFHRVTVTVATGLDCILTL